MKKAVHLFRFLVLFILFGFAANSYSQTPTYSVVVKNDTLINAKTYQFDVYIYQTGTNPLYLNNFQLAFKIANYSSIINGGTMLNPIDTPAVQRAVYVPGTCELDPYYDNVNFIWTYFDPAKLNTTIKSGVFYFRVDGGFSTTYGTLVPTTGKRIGTFRLTNSAVYGQSKMNIQCWNASPYTTTVRAIVGATPPNGPKSASSITTYPGSHTTNLTDPVLNPTLTVYNVTGGGTYAPPTTGLAVGLSGSEIGVFYRLIKNGTPTSSDKVVAGTGSAITFGLQTAGTYTVRANKPAVYYTDMNGSATVILSVDKTLTLTNVMLESLFAGSATMHQAQDDMGPHWPAGIADHITVELHNASTYSTIVYTATDVELTTSGTAIVTVPSTFSSSYYITIKHRNSIETTTDAAVSFAGSTITQSFGLPTNVYGGNLGGPVNGHYYIYGGDVNQDGYIDTGDYIDIETDAYNYLTGYLTSDVNGDGYVDTSDYIIVETNAYNYVSTILP